MIRYCNKCKKEIETEVIFKKEIYEVLGEDIEVDSQILACSECGNNFYYEDFDKVTLIVAYNKYRKNHNLLFPIEIEAIRRMYCLSQINFAKLLNWSDKAIRKYESGTIQSREHNDLLVFLKDPRNMKSYLSKNKVNLDEKTLDKLTYLVDRLILKL